MLLELQIRDFAIIERLHLRLDRTFNVLTGETGAGKSIIIDALGMLRGEKPDPSLVRAGCSRARIEGVFTLADCPEVVPVLREYDLWEEEDEQVILTREVNAESGRSVARINGRAVNTSILREVGGRLVDIHGQHEGLSLFNTRTHLDMLDRHGGLLPLREQVSEQVARLRQVREELADLRRSEARRTERIEELRFLIEDVSAAQLRPNEEAELAQERSMLQNAVRITELVTSAYAILYQGEEGGRYPARPIVEALADVVGNLGDLARLDPTVQTIATQAEELHYQLEDLAANVRAYRDQLDFDPRRLDEIEDRLTLIRTLQRKYGGEIADILEQAARAEAEIDRLTHSTEHMADLEAREAQILAELGTSAGTLSRRRRATGDALAQAIEATMGDLAMPHVKFYVNIAQDEDPAGVPMRIEHAAGNNQKEAAPEAAPPKRTDQAPLRRYQFSPTGVDRVEFLLSPNPGEPLKPLARIASGGESARLLLALKSILSRADTIPTLIFDEIDVGVGGRAGQVVGQKLWAMTEAHQVICITHLPQVAAFADAHYAISKEVSAERTRTQIRTLTIDERVDELAAMLDGTPVSEHSRANAREIIERALALKDQANAGRTTASEQPEPTTEEEALKARELQSATFKS